MSTSEKRARNSKATVDIPPGPQGAVKAGGASTARSTRSSSRCSTRRARRSSRTSGTGTARGALGGELLRDLMLDEADPEVHRDIEADIRLAGAVSGVDVLIGGHADAGSDQGTVGNLCKDQR